MSSPTQSFGGNSVRDIDLDATGQHRFADHHYHYSCLNFGPGSHSLSTPELQTSLVYALELPEGSTISTPDAITLAQGDALLFDQTTASLSIQGPTRLLLAGVANSAVTESKVTHTPAAEIYKVSKPWGHELWLNGQHPDFALKQIFIKKGTKTSLQYHNFKKETNVLFEGEALLHYNGNPDRPNDDVTAEDIKTYKCLPVSAIDVSPPVIHRLEAFTDILLYETSTPHLDDVIRISDDAQRPDGRIDDEHSRA